MGLYGKDSRIITLLGVGETKPWAWNGSMAKLEDQVAQSITSTMAGPKATVRPVDSLDGLLMNYRQRRRGRGLQHEEAVRRVQSCLRQDRNCARCTRLRSTPRRRHTKSVWRTRRVTRLLTPAIRGRQPGWTLFSRRPGANPRTRLLATQDQLNVNSEAELRICVVYRFHLVFLSSGEAMDRSVGSAHACQQRRRKVPTAWMKHTSDALDRGAAHRQIVLVPKHRQTPPAGALASVEKI